MGAQRVPAQRAATLVNVSERVHATGAVGMSAGQHRVGTRIETNHALLVVGKTAAAKNGV